MPTVATTPPPAPALDLCRAYALARAQRRGLSPIEAIAVLEDAGHIVPRCPDCAHLYKDAIEVRDRLAADPAWRPPTSHQPSPRCLRDRQPHCGCGPCTGRDGRV